jgi:carbonic anhydrase
LIDNWLRHIQDIAELYKKTLDRISDSNDRLNRLCELNVIEQVVNAAETTFVQKAWKSGQDVRIHGWIYDLSDGIFRDLGVQVKSDAQTGVLRQQFWGVEN